MSPGEADATASVAAVKLPPSTAAPLTKHNHRNDATATHSQRDAAIKIRIRAAARLCRRITSFLGVRGPGAAEAAATHAHTAAAARQPLRGRRRPASSPLRRL